MTNKSSPTELATHCTHSHSPEARLDDVSGSGAVRMVVKVREVGVGGREDGI